MHSPHKIRNDYVFSTKGQVDLNIPDLVLAFVATGNPKDMGKELLRQVEEIHAAVSIIDSSPTINDPISHDTANKWKQDLEDLITKIREALV